jgi:hypothetical protein
MSNIQDFLGKKTGGRVARYKELAEGKTEEEKRKLEMRLLKPEKIPPHVTEKANYNTFSPIATHTVHIIFPDDESLALFKRHFKVGQYVKPSLTDIDKLVAILQLLEDEIIVYDNKLNKASVRLTNGKG